MIHIAQNLKYLRIKNDISQADLSAKIKLTHSAIASYETGGVLPNTTTIIRLGKIFKVKLHDLCFKNMAKQ